MINTDCQNCGSKVFVFAGACRHCGAPNRARLGALAVAGSLLMLIVAVGAAAFMVLRWDQISTRPTEDLTWLTAAMDECDVAAEKAPETLHFLVIPMTSSPADDDEWRSKSLNDIGNAILLTQRETLDGLMGGTLRLSSEQYEFNMRDEATTSIYKWSPSVGVKKFLIPNAAQIKEFKVQFKTRQRTADLEWGATFVHRQGTCYWVNAIIGH